MKKTFYLLSVFLLFATIVNAQITAQWRGNDRKGIYDEKNLLKTWTADGPKQLWINENIGNGYGAPAVTSDRLYITGELDSLAYLFAFDLKNNLLWKSDFGNEGVKTFQGSRSTPTVVGDLIYVCSGLGNVACFDAKTGQRKWFVDMMKEFHGQYLLHGHSESPMIDGDKVFLVPGGVDTNVVAMNRFTGKLVWKCKGNGERAGYNSPYLINLGKRHLLVTFTAYSLMGIDAETGELLWTHAQDNTPLAERKPGYGDTHSNTIWYEDGFIYYIAGDGNCAVKLELLDNGKQVKEIWRNKDVDNFMGGFIKSGNYIYTCTTGKKDFRIMNTNSGVVVDSLKLGTGTLISAENMLYYYNQKGEVMLLKPNNEKVEKVSSFKITKGTKEHFAHPVIGNGVLYIRHGKALMAYDIKS